MSTSVKNQSSGELEVGQEEVENDACAMTQDYQFTQGTASIVLAFLRLFLQLGLKKILNFPFLICLKFCDGKELEFALAEYYKIVPMQDQLLPTLNATDEA